jgi:O-acetylserine/cysteine efflux transporter
MPVPHLLLALAVVFLWGTNFVVIKWGLAELPPFLFACLRFALSAWPCMLFVRRPPVGWGVLAAFGLLHGAVFGLLFLAIRADITPGLASLVVQSQVFLTIGLGMALGGERPRALQIGALALAAAGIAWIAARTDGGALTPFGLVTVLAAALCWAGANQVARRAGPVDALGFMSWSSMFAAVPLLGLSLALEGPGRVVDALAAAGGGAWAAVAWQAFANSLFGFGAWNWLLARHPAALVTPSALLVPVFGLGASALLLAEPLPAWKLGAAALVLAGLALNLHAGRRRATATASVSDAAGPP